MPVDPSVLVDDSQEAEQGESAEQGDDMEEQVGTENDECEEEGEEEENVDESEKEQPSQAFHLTQELGRELEMGDEKPEVQPEFFFGFDLSLKKAWRRRSEKSPPEYSNQCYKPMEDQEDHEPVCFVWPDGVQKEIQDWTVGEFRAYDNSAKKRRCDKFEASRSQQVFKKFESAFNPEFIFPIY